nr:MAG TPA: hypothetical protein [Caudoviricetes sp.]
MSFHSQRGKQSTSERTVSNNDNQMQNRHERLQQSGTRP